MAVNQSDSVNASVPINQVLDASCKADPDQCQVLFDQLSSDIKSPRFGCGKDLEKSNSLALQALTGLSSYRLMREVACLTTRETPKAGKPQAANPNKNLSSTALAGQRTSPGLVAANSIGGSTEPPARYCFVNAMSSQNPDDLVSCLSVPHSHDHALFILLTFHLSDFSSISTTIIYLWEQVCRVGHSQAVMNAPNR
jgi:hypothetical protein